MTSVPWPPFALRLSSARLVLRPPDDALLAALAALAREGIHDPAVMPFLVPWTRKPSPQFEREFLQFHWRLRADLSPRAWGLELVALLDGRVIGCQGLYASDFAVARTVRTGSWLGRAFQGRGYGKEMRAAVLALAFDHLGAELAETSAFLDNPASLGVSRALGYEENGRVRTVVEGVAREHQRFRLTREGWRARPRPSVTVEGLDALRPMLGA